MKTVVIVQCRLSSTRLPRKALYELDGKPLLSWALSSMKKVPADDYFVACDFDSETELAPVVKESGFKLYAGPKDDVLKRFCGLIERENADIVVRATADNPFLFYEAADELLQLYKTQYCNEYDYITFSGLPHGSGIEIFKGASLRSAERLTNEAFVREHVGPALYNHPEHFKSLFLKSPDDYYFPELRTTVDTYADYLRASQIVEILKQKNISRPYTAHDVTACLKNTSVAKKILYIPCIKKGRGTGHVRRCVELAKKTGGAVFFDAESGETIDFEPFAKMLSPLCVVKKRPLENEYDLIVCDMFRMTREEINSYTALGKTVFIDEGSAFCDRADYVLNIIPPLYETQKENFSGVQFIEKPANQKKAFPVSGDIQNVLVCFGGEDPAHLSERFVPLLLKMGFCVTVISGNESAILRLIPENYLGNLTVKKSVPDLKETLYEYDLAVTHYGFTAFECVASKTPVLLAATTGLHKKLSAKYGFTCLSKNQIRVSSIKKLLSNPERLKPRFHFPDEIDSKNAGLDSFILNLSGAQKYQCPVCRSANTHGDALVERTAHHTFRKCANCGMIYLSLSDDSETVRYEKSYFNEEYKNQYGKTYLEDFESIKKNCTGRMKIIDALSASEKTEKRILDIGCAYGPFLSAAKDKNWIPHGSDVCDDAVLYVSETLGFKAANASFALFDIKKEFGVSEFDAVTMWYVIEHIKDLKSNLTAVNKMLKTGGIFAFSTPNASGISRRTNAQQFFAQSPKDHYSLWELNNTQRCLSRFGFKICKIVPTGIHPERIPFIKKHFPDERSAVFRAAKLLMKLFKCGDTYEVYCKKIGGIKQ